MDWIKGPGNESPCTRNTFIMSVLHYVAGLAKLSFALTSRTGYKSDWRLFFGKGRKRLVVGSALTAS